MNNKVFALKKLQKELTYVNSEMDTVSAGLIDNNLLHWNLMIEGPPDTLYEGGMFRVELKFPEDYPNNPPEMIFVSEMWHPNIYPDGKVCINEFNQQERMDEKWRPVLGVEEVLHSVISMLSAPNIESPANVDAAVHYRDDFEGYNEKVRRLTNESLNNL